MRYLTFSADYASFQLKDDFGGPVDLESLNLTAQLIEAMDSWNAQYQIVIKAGETERQDPQMVDVIDALDNKAWELIQRLSVELDQTKIKYYSEGLLKYVQDPR